MLFPFHINIITRLWHLFGYISHSIFWSPGQNSTLKTWENGDNNGEADDAGEDGEENAENNNNNNEDNGEEDEEEAQEPNIHDDVWDALISDDLRQIGELYQKKTLNIDEYLE